jgi:hypothetical protein
VFSCVCTAAWSRDVVLLALELAEGGELFDFMMYTGAFSVRGWTYRPTCLTLPPSTSTSAGPVPE